MHRGSRGGVALFACVNKWSWRITVASHGEDSSFYHLRSLEKRELVRGFARSIYLQNEVQRTLKFIYSCLGYSKDIPKKR